MSNWPTNFVESNALFAVAENEMESAKEMLRTMLPGELEKLARDARALSGLCWQIRSELPAGPPPFPGVRSLDGTQVKP